MLLLQICFDSAIIEIKPYILTVPQLQSNLIF